MKLRVLIACEESQATCKAFRALGHEAYSCDIQDCSGGHPEWHLKCDVLPLLKIQWDLIIAHPPCTFMSKAEAIDWMESKGIVIELSYDDQGHMDNARWQYFIYTHDEDGWVEGMVRSWMEGNYFKTRLEAEEAAIIKACELL